MAQKKAAGSRYSTVFRVRDKLQTEDQCLLRENHIVLPTALRRRLLANSTKVTQYCPHEAKLRQSYWWPGQDIESFLKNYTWNARKLRRYLVPEESLLHHHDTAAPPVRRSRRQNRGVPPARYPDEL
ncbi:Zf-h2c2 and rve domain containing protein [Plakobranchus ocellatus]|uniref:Zf-h2c2 and rve domain containing protein n=1 Tax=Plakobranchus ocellatus TaxID=259542 RepID=A0AAV4BRW2_9GAST|nr:Zf-h2c2 and rve domain containing protein [Plakobranchus ocellatus]